MKTYKLIKPIGDYPLEEYTKEWDKYVIAKTLEFEWGGSYKIFHYIPAEIVENMPEYFVEVKEDWKRKAYEHFENDSRSSLGWPNWYTAFEEAIEKYMPKQEIDYWKNITNAQKQMIPKSQKLCEHQRAI